MTQSLAHMDEYGAAACPSQLRAPVLHSVINDPDVQKLTLGGKGVGSNGDGTVQFVCAGADQAWALCQLLSSKLGMPSFCLVIPKNKNPQRKPV